MLSTLLFLDLDHCFILETVAAGRARCEAEMVRLVGRNASFCSRAVDRLVNRGWLKKRLKLKGGDIKFQVKITARAGGVYQDLQFKFAERVNDPGRCIGQGHATCCETVCRLETVTVWPSLGGRYHRAGRH
jgi:hypothetical protein